MASTYAISGGDGQVAIGVPLNTVIVGCDVISDAALDSGDVVIKLVQSSDGIEFHDLPETPLTMDIAANANLLQTASYVGVTLYVDIVVNTATLGTLSLYAFGK